MKKQPTSIRLSKEGKQLRILLAQKLGLSESAIVELAIRRLAEMEGIKLENVQVPTVSNPQADSNARMDT